MSDPITGSLILSGIGAAVSTVGTIAGGANAATLGKSQQNAAGYQSAQLRENASGEIAAAQRTMFDVQQRARLAQSKLTAAAAGGGFTASVGSPEALSESIARRGSYEAAINLFQGENAATGDLNKAQGVDMSGEIAKEGGEMQQRGAYLSAAGNLATAGGSMFKTYGALKTGSTDYGSTARI